MRVVAGSAKGRRLVSPPGTSTRPTSDRVREATFNSLFSLGGVEGLRVVDLFAGTGALGIEALSRGARHCTFVERDRGALRALRQNLDTTAFADRATVLEADASASATIDRVGPVDLALADAPYDFDGWGPVLAALDTDLVVIESARGVEMGERWELLRSRSYRSTVVTIARCVEPRDLSDARRGR
jgi:16S rRNA (guanine966-N2)-methyltransferase